MPIHNFDFTANADNKNVNTSIPSTNNELVINKIGPFYSIIGAPIIYEAD